jgi:hypothetical protein
MLSKKALSTNTFTVSLMMMMTFVVLIFVSSNNKIVIMQPPQQVHTQTSTNNQTPASADNVPNIHSNGDNDNGQGNQLSFWGYQNKKAVDRTLNPTLPPERSYEQTYGVPVNIPTRGISGGYQQIGTLHKETVDSETITVGQNSDPVILPLYGKPTYPGSNKWAYYTSSDKFNAVKLPVSNGGKSCNSEYGCTELYSDDSVALPAYNGNFKVTIYEYDKPHYIPYA